MKNISEGPGAEISGRNICLELSRQEPTIPYRGKNHTDQRKRKSILNALIVKRNNS